ncbi:hypothetical protein ACO0LO_28570, partial [Undibacterium sp. TJN25]|uniref:hypothetical protein n=1 Tax=Undibacterium sp. TJN25 TaxID=3413056 RepID=UPI003BF2513A
AEKRDYVVFNSLRQLLFNSALSFLLPHFLPCFSRFLLLFPSSLTHSSRSKTARLLAVPFALFAACLDGSRTIARPHSTWQALFENHSK